MPAVDTRPQFKTFPSLRPNSNEEGLVGAWDFGDPVNGVCPDLSGNGNNGTIYNGPCVTSTPLGRGLDLVSGTKYVDCGAGSTLDITGSLTISAWIYPTTVAGTEPLVFKFNAPNGYYVWLSTAGNIEFVTLGTSTTILSVASSALRLNAPNHLVFTYDPNGGANNKRIYLNGNIIAQATITGSINSAAATSLWWSRYAANYGDYIIISGSIYNRAISESEVRAKYLKAKSAMWRAGYGVGVSSADEGGILNDTLGKQSGDTGIRFGDTVGRWRIETDTIQGKLCKVVTCKTAGLLYIPTAYFGQNTTEAAFGTWEWWWLKSLDATTYYLGVIASAIANPYDAAYNGYAVVFSASERWGLYRYNAGVQAALFTTNASYMALGTWYKNKLTRTPAASFTGYMNDNLVDVTGGAGTNPVVDVTHTTASYVAATMGVGDKLGWSCPTGQNSLKKHAIALP